VVENSRSDPSEEEKEKVYIPNFEINDYVIENPNPTTSS
jgi:hypothetical protein